jgi:hypothetical protein
MTIRVSIPSRKLFYIAKSSRLVANRAQDVMPPKFKRRHFFRFAAKSNDGTDGALSLYVNATEGRMRR